MPMQLTLSTLLDCPFDQAAAHAKTLRLLQHVARPLMHITPEQPPPWPTEWPEGTHWASLRLFGVVPLGRQAIVISYPPFEGGVALRDNGHSALIRRWDHRITLEPVGSQTRYTDHLTLDAGWRTLPVWLFAQVFYRHRQRRWRALVRRGFRY